MELAKRCPQQLSPKKNLREFSTSELGDWLWEGHDQRPRLALHSYQGRSLLVPKCCARKLPLEPLRLAYCGRVIAPCDADETNAAYFANTPVGYRGCCGFHAAIRCFNSPSLISTSSTRFFTSKRIMSPSRTAAIAPPFAASGAT